MFLFIILITCVVQIILVQLGGVPIRCCPLTVNEHAICIIIGMLSIVNGFLVKALLPSSLFKKWHMNEEEMSDEKDQNTLTTKLRKSFRQSMQRGSSLRSKSSLSHKSDKS
jgi:hypothetical protein